MKFMIFSNFRVNPRGFVTNDLADLQNGLAACESWVGYSAITFKMVSQAGL